MASEFELIARHFTRPTPGAVLGIGDDCALLRPASGCELAVSKDLLVEGRHFLAGTDAMRLGHKCLAVNLSDLAAMGAMPRWVMLGVALPAADEDWVEAFARGFFGLADRHHVELVGGDTTRGPLTVSVTVFGELPAGTALRRDAARQGDDIWVSGTTGEAALGLAHLQGRTQIAPPLLAHCLDRLEQPWPRLEPGLRLRGVAHGAIDVSDGLLADLGHILARSGVGAELELPRIPVAPALRACADAQLARDCLLAGGDDYELVFTAPVAQRAAIEALSFEPALPLTRIGRVVEGAGLRLLDAQGRDVVQARRGYDHFAAGA